MPAMKKTLLEIVTDILNDLECEQVNDLDDTEESQIVTTILINTYFDLIAGRVIPEHKELIRLTALGDSARPTTLILPDSTATLLSLKYNKSISGYKEFEDLLWREPQDFIDMLCKRNSSSADVTTSLTVDNSIELLVFNDRMPTYYTTFDNKYIICDAHHSTYDTTLQSSKTLAYAESLPSVTRAAGTTLDFESKYFPYLYNEALSKCSLRLNKTLDQKAEQWSKRHRASLQKNKERIERIGRRAYGRR